MLTSQQVPVGGRGCACGQDGTGGGAGDDPDESMHEVDPKDSQQVPTGGGGVERVVEGTKRKAGGVERARNGGAHYRGGGVDCGKKGVTEVGGIPPAAAA